MSITAIILAPALEDAVHAEPAPAHISADVIIGIMENFARICPVEEMRVTSVRTGPGRFTAHHFSDADYIVDFDVWYADLPGQRHEATFGIGNGVMWCEC